VGNVGRRAGGNNCDKPTDAISRAGRHGWITETVSESIAAVVAAA
jgi:hypothetical protein